MRKSCEEKCELSFIFVCGKKPEKDILKNGKTWINNSRAGETDMNIIVDRKGVDNICGIKENFYIVKNFMKNTANFFLPLK